MKTYFSVALIVLTAIVISCTTSQKPNTVQTTQRMVPPDGKMMLFIGQDLEMIKGYMDSDLPRPSGTVGYSYFFDSIAGLRDKRDTWGSGWCCGKENLDNYPNATFAIGLRLVETDSARQNINKLLKGEFDQNVEHLANFVKKANRPVYVRIGYEFDGPWNHYSPEEYVAAFKYITDKAKPIAGDNFVTVWQAATSPVGVLLDSLYGDFYYTKLKYDDWYPGDEYVDWVGFSYFLNDPKQFELNDSLLNFARRHDKPVMLCESAPQSFDLDAMTKRNVGGNWDGYPGNDTIPKTSEQIWNEWYAPYFDYVYKNTDAIRAVHYINCNWDSQFMWSADNIAEHAPRGYAEGYWGDTRIEINEYISKRWKEEMQKSVWLLGDESTLSQIKDRAPGR